MKKFHHINKFVSKYAELFKKIKNELDIIANSYIHTSHLLKNNNSKDNCNNEKISIKIPEYNSQSNFDSVLYAKILLLQSFTIHLLLENEFITFKTESTNLKILQKLKQLSKHSTPSKILCYISKISKSHFYNKILSVICNSILNNKKNFIINFSNLNLSITFYSNISIPSNLQQTLLFQPNKIFKKLPNSIFFNSSNSGILDVYCQFKFFIPDYFTNIKEFIHKDLQLFIKDIYTPDLSYNKNIPNDISVNSTLTANINENDSKHIDSIKALGIICEILSCVDQNNFNEFLQTSNKNINKKTGSFYTPTEIVYYICTESIRLYLLSNKNLNLNNNINTDEIYKTQNNHNIDSSAILNFKNFNKKLIIKVYKILSNIRICDISCGAGDFLLIASEILTLFRCFTLHLAKSNLKSITKLFISEAFECYKNNLYGIEINYYSYLTTILRLWLKTLWLYKLILALNHKFPKISCSQHNQNIINTDALCDTLEYQKFLPHIFTQANNNQDNGFDIIITNPPYIGEKGNKELLSKYKNSTFANFYYSRGDIYYYFIYQALNLLKPSGIAGLIVPNYFTTASYAHKLRKDIKKRSIIRKIINFNNTYVFKNLSTHTMILFLEKESIQNLDKTNKSLNSTNTFLPNTENYDFCNLIVINKYPVELDSKHTSSDQSPNLLHNICNKSTQITISQSEIFYGSKDYILSNLPITNDEYVVKKSFSILEKIKSCPVRLSEICQINQGIITGADKVSSTHIKKYNLSNTCVGDGIFILSKDELIKLKPSSKELLYIKPWYKNSDIYKWVTSSTPKEYVIYLNQQNENIHLEIPNLYCHLQNYKAILENRREVKNGSRKWYEIWWSREERIFISPKIVVPHRCYYNKFAYNDFSWYASADVYFITTKLPNVCLKYLLSILNSPLYYLWFYICGKRKGKMLELYHIPLSELPIKLVSEDISNILTAKTTQLIINLSDKKNLIDYRNKINKNNLPNFDNAEANILEKQIFDIVYQIYQLDHSEIEFISNFFVDTL